MSGPALSYRILARGDFDVRAIAERRGSFDYVPPEAVRRTIEQAWVAALTRAAESGQHLYNADLVRLAALEESGSGLCLSYGRTCYRDYAMTRASCPARPWADNPDPIGTAIIALTTDGMVPIGRRSLAVDVNPGRYFTFGGFFDAADSDPASDVPDIFRCATREWNEETGLPLNVAALRLISVVYDLVYPHPEIGFTARLEINSSQMKQSRWAAELDHLEFIPATQLFHYAMERADQFTDSLLGAVKVFDENLRSGRYCDIL